MRDFNMKVLVYDEANLLGHVGAVKTPEIKQDIYKSSK